VNNLPELLNFVVTTLQRSPLCGEVYIISTNLFSDSQFALKVRAELLTGSMLQVHLYRNSEHVDYAYQLVVQEKPI
jgi:hypothetical protein